MTSIAELHVDDDRSGVPAAAVGLAVATALSLLWLLLPPTGSDLSAQVSHAHFVGAHSWHPVDLQWFGGTSWPSYSVLVPPLMATVGVRLVGVIATVTSAALWGLLMSRCAVPRARAGAVAGAVCLAANLVVGRITFAVGIAAALATTLALTYRHPLRWFLLILGPVVSWAASPLAALFLGLVGVALVVRRQRWAEGLVVTVAVLGALGASLWLGQGGYMPASVGRGIAGLVACGVVALVTKYRLVRIGAALAAAGVLLSLTLRTPVGVQAIRLPALFAAPLAIATSRLRARILAPAVAFVICLVPPLTADDITAIGEQSNDPSYYRGLVAELQTLPLTGRVEIPPTLQRWETVYVADKIPLARGWLTTLDQGYNPLFFSADLSPSTYRTWLHDNAVQYVAVPDAKLAESGRAEAALISAGLPYLDKLWRDEHWTVYRVRKATSTVTGAQLVSQDAVSVTFQAAAAADVGVRVRWSRWLTLTGPDACLRPAGTWTEVVVGERGTYSVGSAVDPGARNRPCS